MSGLSKTTKRAVWCARVPITIGWSFRGTKSAAGGLWKPPGGVIHRARQHAGKGQHDVVVGRDPGAPLVVLEPQNALARQEVGVSAADARSEEGLGIRRAS